MSSILIKHADGEEYIIGIVDSLLSGLNDYLNTYYPTATRHYLNELPVSCKQFVDCEPLPMILLIVESPNELTVHCVMKKVVPGWITSSEKYRSERMFSVRLVKFARDVLKDYSELRKIVSNAETQIEKLQLEITKLNADLDRAYEREELISSRMDQLITFLPPDRILDFTRTLS